MVSTVEGGLGFRVCVVFGDRLCDMHRCMQVGGDAYQMTRAVFSSAVCRSHLCISSILLTKVRWKIGKSCEQSRSPCRHPILVRSPSKASIITDFIHVSHRQCRRCTKTVHNPNPKLLNRQSQNKFAKA